VAIAYRAGVAGNNGISATTTDVTFLGLPASSAVNDLVIVGLVGSLGSQTISSAPAGWNALSPSPITTGSITSWLYWKILVSGDLIGSKTWSIAGTAGRPVGAMNGYSGVDTGTPFDDTQSNTAASSTTGTVPAVTSTHASDFIHNIWAARNGTGGAPTYTMPGTHTAETYSGTSFPSGAVNTAIQSGRLTTPGAAGTYGTYAATLSVAATHALWSLALRPASDNAGQFFAMF
jgi:hypothetical protein